MTNVNLNRPLNLEPPHSPEDGDVYLDINENTIMIFLGNRWVHITSPSLQGDDTDNTNYRDAEESLDPLGLIAEALEERTSVEKIEKELQERRRNPLFLF